MNSALLKEALAMQAIMDDDDEWAMQALRDTFPEGVAMQDALAYVKELNQGKPFLAICALTILAMVPVSDIKLELLNGLMCLKNEGPKSEESFRYRFNISQALFFIGAPEGTRKFEELRAVMKSYPEHQAPVAVS